MPDADLVHLSYGGLGGHMGVVNTLTHELAKLGLTSGVVAVGPEAELDTSTQSWPGASWVLPVTLDPSNKLRDYGTAFRLARNVRSRVVLAHTHRLVPGFAAGQRLAGLQCPIVVAEHNSWSFRTKRDDFSSLLALACSRGLVFLTEDSRAHYRPATLARALRRVSRVIPNGLDMRAFSPKSAVSRGSRVRIGTLGRLIPAKGLEVLIMAVSLVRNAGLEVELDIAGEGPARGSLQALAENEGAAPFVQFIGHLPRAQVPAFLHSLDIYAHPSTGETLSMALLEAAASRLPIVACSVPGVKDVYTNGVDALLVPPNDASALAAAIRQAADPDIAAPLGINARRLVEDHYSSTRMAERYLDLLKVVSPSGPWGPSAVGKNKEGR